MATNNSSSNFGSSILARPTDARPAAFTQRAWAGQGAKNYADRPVSIAEAIEDAGLNFIVEKQPIARVSFEDGVDTAFIDRKQVIPSHMATVRTDNDTLLGVVGKDYGVVQNTKAFEFIDFIKEVANEEPVIETAGAFGKGERIFVTTRLGADCFLSPKDAVKNYVVFTNTHDGTGSVMAFFSPVRVVCQNTLNMAIKGAVNKITFRHSSQVNKRLDWEIEENRKRAMEVFSKGVNFSKHFLEAMLNLKSQYVNDDYVKDFAASVYLNGTQMDLFRQNNRSVVGIDEISSQLKNKVQALEDAIDFGIGQDLYRGTKLHLLNGLTTFFHNELKHKDVEAELASTLSGDVNRKVQLAYDRLVKVPA